MAWGKAGSSELTSSASEVETTVSVNKFSQILNHVITAGSGNIGTRYRFNDDSGSKYAQRWSHDGGSDGNAVNQAQVFTEINDADEDRFQIGYLCSISGEEKLGINHLIETATGAGNAPQRSETVFKYVPSPDATITSVKVMETVAGSFGSGTNLTVLGSDITPAAAITFPTNVQVGSRAEITDTRKMYNYENGLEYEDNFSSDGDWVFTTSNASITGGVLQCTQYRSANDSATTSVGTSIGTKFLQQFEYEVDSYPSGTGASAYYGLWSLPNTTGANTGGQDYVVLHNNDGVLHKISVGQNTSAYGGTGTTGSTWITLTIGTKYYIELIGNGDNTYTLNIRTVSHTGSHVTNSPQTVTKTGLSNLQYFGFKNTTGGGNGGTVTKTDDLKIYKGTTTTTGNTWKEIGS